MFKQTDEGVEISLYIQPGASKTEIIGEHNGCLKIKIKAPPVDGKANAEVIEFLSDKLGIPKRQIEFLTGDKSREKKIRIKGLSIQQIESLMKGS
jgi:hypothetical protein